MKFTNMKTKVAVLALSLLALNSSHVFSSPAPETQCGAEMGKALGNGLFDEKSTQPFVESVEEVIKILESYATDFDDQVQYNKAVTIAKALHTYIKSIKKADLSHAQKIGVALEKLYATLPKHVFDALETAFLERQAFHINKRKPLDKLALGLKLIKRINKQ
jgi:hypothetical protein